MLTEWSKVLGVFLTEGQNASNIKKTPYNFNTVFYVYAEVFLKITTIRNCKALLNHYTFIQ